MLGDTIITCRMASAATRSSFLMYPILLDSKMEPLFRNRFAALRACFFDVKDGQINTEIDVKLFWLMAQVRTATRR